MKRISRSTLGIGSRKHGTGGRGLADPEHRSSLDLESVHDSGDVVHARLDREAARPVGEPDSARVHDDQASPLRKLVTELREALHAPERPDVREEGQEHEIVVAVAYNLVGDSDSPLRAY